MGSRFEQSHSFLAAAFPSNSPKRRAGRQKGSLLPLFLCAALAVLTLTLVHSQFSSAFLTASATHSSSAAVRSPTQSLRSPRILQRAHAQSPVLGSKVVSDNAIGQLLPQLPLETFTGQKLALAMEEESKLSFEELLNREVAQIAEQQQTDEVDTDPSASRSGSQLAGRIRQVLASERSQSISEILHLKVLQQFSEHSLKPVTPLNEGQGASSWPHLEPKALVQGVYRKELVGIVSDHLQTLIGDWDHLVRDFELTVSTFQAGQVYAVSALFGYALRRADVRFLLDKMAGNLKEDSATLADYVAGFGPDEAWSVAAVASKEAEEVLEAQVSMLFGDLLALQEELAQAVRYDGNSGDALEEERATELLRTALANGEVSALQLSVGNLRRLALEGYAFGYFLSGAESDLSTALELTAPAAEASTPGSVSALAGEVEHMPKFSVFRSWNTR